MRETSTYSPIAFASYESFRCEEWVGHESDWFGTLTALHWTLSCIDGSQSSHALVIQPDSRHYVDSLAQYIPRHQIIELMAATDHEVLLADSSPPDDHARILDSLAVRAPSSIDVILAIDSFRHSRESRHDGALLRACRRVLRPGGHLIAKLRIQDELGNATAARNIQFFDVARQVGFHEREVIGCQGVAGFFKDEFWEKLRAQGEAAFDTVINSLAQINDSPSAQWMSSDVLYIGAKG